MNKVLRYIISLRADGAPCNFTEQEIIGFADKAEQEYAAGTGMMDHSELLFGRR